MIKLMIVDDHPVVREGLVAMLESAKGFRVAASSGSGEDAVSEFLKARPDVIVLDIRLPGMDGFETLERMRRFVPDVKVLLLAGMPLREELDRAKKMGAGGYLPKNIQHTRLLDAIRSVAAGGPFQEESLPEVPNMLSSRELEVLRYVTLGKTRDEVGIILGISSETVKSHIKSIQIKMDATNTAAMISRAYELGVLRP